MNRIYTRHATAPTNNSQLTPGKEQRIHGLNIRLFFIELNTRLPVVQLNSQFIRHAGVLILLHCFNNWIRSWSVLTFKFNRFMPN